MLDAFRYLYAIYAGIIGPDLFHTADEASKYSKL